MTYRWLRLMAPAVCAGWLASAQGLPRRFPVMPPEIIPPDTFHDVLQLDRVHYHLEFENDQVRALRLKLKGDEGVPTHDDRPGLLVCLNECHLRFTRPDGRIQDVHLQAGETRWVWNDTRSEKNLSPRPLELLYIEMKR